MTAAGGGSATAFPWDRALALGLGLLRLEPAGFWAMTPRELAQALAPFAPRAPAFARGELDALLRRFPDQTPQGGDDG